MRRRLLLLAPAPTALLAVAGVSAYFTTMGSGIAAGNVGTLSAPSNVTASNTAGTTTVQVAWTAASLSDGTAPTGYAVQRFAGAAASTACGGSLAGSATSCDDTGLAAGTYTYKVTAVYRTWTAVSAASNAVTVVSDATPPSTTLTFPTSGSTVNAAAYAAGCSTAGICGTASDSSGVQSVRVSIRQASGSYWNGTAFASSTELFQSATLASPKATSTSWSYPLARPTDGSYTVHVQATDTAGNATPSGTFSSTSTFTVDTAAPHTPTAVSLVNGAGTGNAYVNSANQASIDVDVTLDSTSVATDTVTLTIQDTGTPRHNLSRTAAATAGAGTVHFTGIDLSALNQGTVTISATSTDSAGNVSSALTATVTKDTVAPAAPTASYSDGSSRTGDVISGTGEAGATITLSETAPAVQSFSGTAGSGGAWSVAVDNINGSGKPKSYSYSVTQTDAAGNTGAATTVSGTDSN